VWDRGIIRIWERAHESTVVAVGYSALINLGAWLIESDTVTGIYGLDGGKQSVERIDAFGTYGVVCQAKLTPATLRRSASGSAAGLVVDL